MTGMVGWEGLSFPGCQKIREFHRIHRLLDASITEYGLKLVLKAMNPMKFVTFLAVLERRRRDNRGENCACLGGLTEAFQYT